jgi:hypothetical protein
MNVRGSCARFQCTKRSMIERSFYDPRQQQKTRGMRGF